MQYTFRLLAHYGFKPHPAITAHLLRIFAKMGDSRMIEEGHRVLTDHAERDQGKDELTPIRAFQQISRDRPDHPLLRRGIDTLVNTPDSWMDGQWKMPEGLTERSVFDPHSAPLPEAGYCENVKGQGKRPYVTKSPAGAHQAISAAAALSHAWSSGAVARAGFAWQSCAMSNYTVVRNKSTSLSYLILASSTYASRAWRLVAMHAGEFGIDAAKEWEWVVVFDVHQWEFVPTEWVVNRKDVQQLGFLSLHAISGAVPLVAAALARLGPRACRLPAWAKKSVL